MKKTFILLSAICLTLIACKKDRTCSCKDTTTTSVTFNGQTTTTQDIDDYTVVMKETSRKTAYTACTHRIYTSTGAAYSSTTDINCELK